MGHDLAAALALLLLTAAPLSGCSRSEGDGEPAPAAADDEPVTPENAERKLAEAAAALPEGGDSRERACGLLTEARVRGAFDLAQDVAIETPPGRFSCTYTWEKPNADAIREELQKAQAARVREMMKRMRKGETAQGLVDLMNMPSTTARVALSLPPRTPESAEEARRAFDRSLEVLQEGITRRVKTDQVDEDVTFQADVTRVSGVGDAAGWAPKLHQLTVLDGARLWHLTVEVHETAEEDLAAAKRLAGALVGD